MNHHRQKTIIALLQLNKMIPAAQRPDLIITRLQLSQKLGVLLIPFHLLKGAVHGIRRHHHLVMCESHRHIPHNIADHSLHQIPVPGHHLPNLLYRNIRLRISHPAADIHAHRIRNHHILRGNHPADGHPHPGMGIRHQANPLM